MTSHNSQTTTTKTTICGTNVALAKTTIAQLQQGDAFLVLMSLQILHVLVRFLSPTTPQSKHRFHLENHRVVDFSVIEG